MGWWGYLFDRRPARKSPEGESIRQAGAQCQIIKLPSSRRRSPVPRAHRPTAGVRAETGQSAHAEDH
eukprot:171752-Pyramimonas_sp.AAC.1